MSLQVYFDGTLINEDYYTKLTNSYELFNESFKLGTTPCNTYKLQIAKETVQTTPSHVTLKDSGTTFAELEIDNIEEIDDTFVELTLTDKMVNLDFRYDASEIFQNGSTTLLLIVQDICTKAGLNLGTVNFRGYDKVINWYDNTRTAREYIGMVAELNGGFARIENNTLYFRKQNTLSVKTIDIDDCADFKIGEYHKITRVVYELGALKYEYGDETGNTLYLNSENVYITEASEVEAIYNEMKDFEFYSFKTSNCPVDYSVKAGDMITFTYDGNNYPTIAQYELEYFGDWIGGYSLEVNTERQENTKIIGEKDRIRDLKIITDRLNNTITQVVSEVDEQNTKISQTQQSVNELNSKIQDIADITTQGETIYASLSLENINQSEPIEVKIYPTTTSISYLYPRSNLYPSDTLYMANRVLRFTNTDTEEVFDYELPDDLLINPNTGTYDEFYLGYDEQICQVTKRCEYNADGSISDLTDEVTTQYTYPTIELTDGDYTIELLGYNNGYMSIRLMAQNIYTTQFATKAELNSEISQTAESITSTVTATYETKQNAQTNYSQLTQTATNIQTQVTNNSGNISTLQQTATSLTSTVATKVGDSEIISKINQSPEAISINANKISLSGKDINLTSDQININSTNFSVDKNGVITAKAGKIAGYNITGDTLYGSLVGMDAESGEHYAFWAGTSINNTENAPFRVGHDGSLKATNAIIQGNITATSGTFQNCTVTNSCTVPASTVTGVLSTENIPNLSASKITSGEINASTINVTNLNASNINNGSISGIPYSFSYGGESVRINTGSNILTGYRDTSPRWSLASFTAGGKLQMFNSSGSMAAYFDQTGAHSSSDIRYKNNVSNINTNQSLKIITSLNPIEFTYKDEKDFHRGLSAQEVEQTLKENGIENQVYEINKEGRYFLNYVELIPDLINCIKYQQQQIEQLQKEIKELKGEKII